MASTSDPASSESNKFSTSIEQTNKKVTVHIPELKCTVEHRRYNNGSTPHEHILTILPKDLHCMYMTYMTAAFFYFVQKPPERTVYEMNRMGVSHTSKGNVIIKSNLFYNIAQKFFHLCDILPTPCKRCHSKIHTTNNCIFSIEHSTRDAIKRKHWLKPSETKYTIEKILEEIVYMQGRINLFSKTTCPCDKCEKENGGEITLTHVYPKIRPREYLPILPHFSKNKY